jgi:hypothetical protein
VHGAITSRWRDAIEAHAQRGDVALLGFLDYRPNDGFDFAIKEPFGDPWGHDCDFGG